MSPYIGFVKAGVFGRNPNPGLVSFLTSCSTFLSNSSSCNITAALEPENKILQILHIAIFFGGFIRSMEI